MSELTDNNTEYNRAMLDEMEAHSIQQRAQAALWLIQAGWDDKVVADVVGLPGLNPSVQLAQGVGANAAS